VHTANDALSKVRDPLTVVNLLSNSIREFGQKNITPRDILEGWKYAGENVQFAFKNPDVAIDYASNLTPQLCCGWAVNRVKGNKLVCYD